MEEAAAVAEITDGIAEMLSDEDDSANSMPTADDISRILAEVESLTDQEIPNPVPEAEESEEPQDHSDQTTMVFNVPVQESDEEAEPEKIETEEKPKGKGARRWIILAIVLLLLAGLAFGGYYFYKNYYVRTVDSIELMHDHGQLTVQVNADAKTDLNTITVHCSGNDTRDSKQLTGGTAVFSIVPGKLYTIELEISGFHTLKGETSTTYITDEKVIIDELSIQVGEEDGSAVINFTPRASEEDTYTGKWVVEYGPEGEGKQTITSETTEVKLSGLTVGKTYNISVYPEIGKNWGEKTTTFVAQPVILAENVTITEYAAGTLGLTWTAPADTTVSSWIVHCYAPDGSYNASPDPVAECTVTFTGLDLTKDYTVEIYAENQTKAQITYVEDTTLSIQNLTAAINKDYFLEITWDCEKEIPADGWTVTYSIEGLEQPVEPVETLENSVILNFPIPGCTYTFSVAPADGSVIVANEAAFTVPEAPEYFNEYGGTLFTNKDITFKMTSRPDDDWTGSSPKYTTSFKVGELAGFITKAEEYYNEFEEVDIHILYVIRDENGNIVRYDCQKRPWLGLFKEYNGYLTVPQLPEEPGAYKLEIYFNGQSVTSQEFKITE